MKKALFLSLLLVGIGSTLSNQDVKSNSSQEPPKIIEITYLDNSAQTGLSSSEFVQALKASIQKDADLNWIAGSMMTGSGPRMALICPFHAYADLEGWHDALIRVAKTKQPAPTWHSWVFELNPEVSYNQSYVPWSKARAYSLNIMYLRRGTVDDYVAEQRLAVELLTKAKVRGEEFIGYSMKYGDDVPAYLFIAPMQSLSDLDVDMSAVHENLFTPEQDRRRYTVLKESVIANASHLLMVLPELSRASESMTRENPNFWNSSPKN